MRLMRRLDERSSIIVQTSYPSKFNLPRLRHSAIIGIGGNVGNSLRRFKHLVHYLNRLRQVNLHGTGIIYKNPPFGFMHQADFFNSVADISTVLTARQLLRLIWRIEKKFGRLRSFSNAPRTLDLDILYFNGQKIKYPELVIPHPGAKERQSVLIPLRSLKGKKVFKGEYHI